ncbi:MAG: diadenylate cyclase CdaA [Candidatus Margulisiibacteriota bacterium]|jgi:diadenylate cyclase
MQQVLEIFSGFNWLDVIDILLVSYVAYRFLLWFKGTRAMQLTRGIFLLLIIYLVSRFIGLETIDWLLSRLAIIIILILIIVFQPELRRMLSRIGQGRLFNKLVFNYRQGTGMVQMITKAVEQMSEQKLGSLIVLEREIGCDEYIESGILLDAKVSSELLLTIFEKSSALHDGAVIIQGNRILAASCLLPLSDSKLLDSRLGTRHRAALGLSENTDAVVIVTSEQTGVISVADSSVLTRYFSKQTLEQKLLALYQEESKESSAALDNFLMDNKQN